MKIMETTAALSSKIFRVIPGINSCHTCKVGIASEKTAVESETNSHSVVDLETTLCLLVPQLTGAKLEGPDTARTNPEVERIDLMSPPKSASQYRERFNSSGGSRMHITGEYSWDLLCKYPMSLATRLSSLADHTVMCFANRVTANATTGLLMRQSHINFIIHLAECGESCPLISSSAGIKAPSSQVGEE